METREVMNERYQNKIEERDVSTQQKHGDDHHQRRVGQLFVAPEAFLFGFPWPRRLLQFGPDFNKEILSLREH